MLIEITGGLGSGKSALAAALSEKLAAEGMSTVVRRAGGRLAADPLNIAWAPLFAVRHRDLWRLVVRATKRDADSWRARAVLLWNIMRKAGMYERLRRRSPAKIVIWDEGTIHMAHNAFAHVRHSPRESEVLEFGRRVPKPDLLVWVRAPSDVALSRVLARGHKRTGADPAAVRALLSNAGLVFASLSKVASIRERMLEVDNDTEGLVDLEVHVETLMAVVRRSEDASRR